MIIDMIRLNLQIVIVFVYKIENVLHIYEIYEYVINVWWLLGDVYTFIFASSSSSSFFRNWLFIIHYAVNMIFV